MPWAICNYSSWRLLNGSIAYLTCYLSHELHRSRRSVSSTSLTTYLFRKQRVHAERVPLILQKQAGPTNQPRQALLHAPSSNFMYTLPYPHTHLTPSISPSNARKKAKSKKESVFIPGIEPGTLSDQILFKL